MTITDEAVLAAAQAITGCHGDGWEYQTKAFKDAYLKDARAALEAAAPHMIREAQAEAWEVCADMPSRPNKASNPYRSQV